MGNEVERNVSDNLVFNSSNLDQHSSQVHSLRRWIEKIKIKPEKG